jgi:hypothetical protein
VGAAEAESEGLRQQAAAACGGSKTPAAPPHASP